MNLSSTYLILVVMAAATLLLGGVGKLRSPGTAAELEGLGVPRTLRHPVLLRMHPWAEIILGAGLLATWSWPLIILSAADLLLMLGYTLLIARAVTAKGAKTCNCFGEFFETTLSGRSIVRNALLVLAAVMALLGAVAGLSVPTAVATDPTVLLPVLAAATVAVTVWAAVSPADETASTTPEAGAPILSGDADDYQRFPIPLAWLKDADGTPQTIRELARQQARLLVFLTTTCGVCASVAEQLPRWAEEFDMLGVHAVFYAQPDEVAAALPDMIPYAVYDDQAEAIRALDIGGFPAAVLLGMDGLLAGGPVLGPAAINDMIDQLRAEFSEAAAATDTDESSVSDPSPDR